MQPPREIPPVGRPGPVAPVPSGRRPVGEKRPTADQVSLSPEGQELLNLRRLIQQAPDMREDLVGRLRQQIEQGEYRPSAREIARHLVRILRPRP